MNDRETCRYDMFGRVQTFGKDHSGDFPAGSKAAGHSATLAPNAKGNPPPRRTKKPGL